MQPGGGECTGVLYNADCRRMPELADGTGAYAPARESSSRASFALGTVSSGFTLYQAR